MQARHNNNNNNTFLLDTNSTKKQYGGITYSQVCAENGTAQTHRTHPVF